jgi:hypothetical protein
MATIGEPVRYFTKIIKENIEYCKDLAQKAGLSYRYDQKQFRRDR